MKPNLNLVNLSILVAGIVLIYAAIKDVDPRDVVKNALKGKPTSGAGAVPNEDDGKGKSWNKTPRKTPQTPGTNPQNGVAI